jgi:hypothetical protein
LTKFDEIELNIMIFLSIMHSTNLILRKNFDRFRGPCCRIPDHYTSKAGKVRNCNNKEDPKET